MSKLENQNKETETSKTVINKTKQVRTPTKGGNKFKKAKESSGNDTATTTTDGGVKKKKRRYRGKKQKKEKGGGPQVPVIIPPKLNTIGKESISSNWNKMLLTMETKKKSSPSTDISPFKKLKLSESKRRERKDKKDDFPPLVKTTEKSDEIWFDDVDESLLELTNKDKKNLKNEEIFVSAKGYKGMTKTVAMDCEMVGVGVGGTDSILARVSIVNEYGYLIYDTYVAPTEKVTDYRTAISGIRSDDLKDAPSFKEVQAKVDEIIRGKTLVGHAIHNDLKALFLTHSRKYTRDTSSYKPFRIQFGDKTPSLKKLCEHYMGVKVQDGEHSSIEDAQAAAKLYSIVKNDWEKSLREKQKKRFEKKPEVKNVSKIEN